MQYLTPSAPQREVARPDNHSPSEGPVASASFSIGPISPCLAYHLGDQPSREAPGRVLDLPAIKPGRPPGSGRPRGQWARPLSAGGSPTALCSPPACPAASHAKDNSNSPLGLSQWPSAIDGETGNPPTHPLTSLPYPGLLPASSKILFGTFSS